MLEQQFPSGGHFQKMSAILRFRRKSCEPTTFLSTLCVINCGSMRAPSSISLSKSAQGCPLLTYPQRFLTWAARWVAGMSNFRSGQSRTFSRPDRHAIVPASSPWTTVQATNPQIGLQPAFRQFSSTNPELVAHSRDKIGSGSTGEPLLCLLIGSDIA
jgi:hypothetical protein